MKKKALIIIAALGLLAACEPAADVASRNLSKAADNFEVVRRVVFYNGITDSYMLEIVGRCSKGNSDTEAQVTITCKNPDGTFVKHFLGLSDNVTYVMEQIEASNVSEFHTRVMFRPQTILPDIDVQGDASELTTNRN